MEGTPFGRYRLLTLLGRGGMGEVWRAHDTETDRIVAIKVLPASLSADEGFQRRFRREAHAAARLSNPHVIPIHHYGEIDGRLYVDMRLVEGRDLQSALSKGPLEPDAAVRIVEQIARALHAAHKEGLIHRDVKPSNILLDSDDFAYLIDFGIAHTLGETRMTATGNAIGSFHYIAPERLDAHSSEDARTDVYSLACVLYEALTGQPPFAGDSMAHLVAAHLHARPPRATMTRPGMPSQIDGVIAAGMAKDPKSRYATTIELADAARNAFSGPRLGRAPDTPWHDQLPAGYAPSPQPGPRRRRITVFAAVGAMVIAGAAITGYLVLNRHGSSASLSAASSTPPSSDAASSSPASPQVRNNLDGSLLSVGQVNTAMGTTGMVSLGIMTAMADISSTVSDQACLPLAAVLQANVYADSGFTSEQAQIIAQPQQNVVDQAVVLFPSPGQASSFFDSSVQSWQSCANHQFTVTANGSSEVQSVGEITNAGGILSATVTPEDSADACQRALTVADNVIVDVTACSGPAEAAVNIARQIAARNR